MNYATIKNCDIANGPGVRVSLFVSGCTHRCPGCFNEVAWDFDYGQPFTEETMDSIVAMLRPNHIKGLTLLGGEPFEPRNQGPILQLLRRVKRELPDKSIWAFSGYLFDRDILERRLGPWEITEEILSYLDVLVDGPFVESRKNLSLRFRGSENQRLIDVPASLKNGEIILWNDWQAEGKGLKNE
ncbi:MAG: anaerobic ribonucleoside-triphosphate reductase activating protein [Oscillospiraceae bacterium]|nr:anaerobic ribonucleoside-triphosphate reductase activating protein [Oscillospiraceae bacterium]